MGRPESLLHPYSVWAATMIDWRSIIHSTATGSWWLLCNFRQFRRTVLRAAGFNSVVPIGIARWHRGARYFRARTTLGEAIFVKTDGCHGLLSNEVAAWHRLSGAGLTKAVIPVRVYALEPPYGFAGFSWIEGQSIARMPRSFWTDENVQKFSSLTACLLDDLWQASVVHRDFSPSNLLISVEKGVLRNIQLIDFAFAVWEGAPICNRVLPIALMDDLAHGYKPEPFVWDDAYACVQIARTIAPSNSRCRELESRVGRLTYRLPVPGAFRPTSFKPKC
jgi:hypothetical protein